MTTFCLFREPEPFIDAERNSPQGTYGASDNTTATTARSVRKPLRPFFFAGAEGGNGGGTRLVTEDTAIGLGGTVTPGGLGGRGGGVVTLAGGGVTAGFGCGGT